jgi:hypothetical protein
MTRSEVRHAVYRKRSGCPKPEYQQVYETIEAMLPGGESWDSFSTGWDVLVIGDDIAIIKPETDYDFIHTTCLEKAMCVNHGLTYNTTARQENVLQIVEAGMLDGLMDWTTYNKTWGVVVEVDVKRIHTKLFLTNVNVVTDEMIAASAKSDGAEMTAIPELPVIELGEFVPMTDEEVAAMGTTVK